MDLALPPALTSILDPRPDEQGNAIKFFVPRKRESTSRELLPQMIQIFVDEMTGQAQSIETAVKTRDFDALARESHILKSSPCVIATDLNRAFKDDNEADAEKLGGRLVD